MSEAKFKLAYEQKDDTNMEKYSKKLSVNFLMTYVELAFNTNKKLYNKLIPILFKRFDLRSIVIDIIGRNNAELLEDMLSYENLDELDPDILEWCLSRGRIVMAKIIFEFIRKPEELTAHKIVKILFDLLVFEKPDEPYCLDSLIMTLYRQIYADPLEILENLTIKLNFWDNFLVRAALENDRLDFLIRLLLDNSVDPGIMNGIIFKKLEIEWRYDLECVSELLKHPLVSIDDADNLYFICHLIKNNWVCVAERLMRSGPANVFELFITDSARKLLIDCCNDVTCVAIKMGLVMLEELDLNKQEKIKKCLDLMTFDTEYVLKPYHLNLDPYQIYYRAIDDNDIDLAKSIVDYSVSIDIESFIILLDSDTKVSRYMMRHVVSQYDPTDLVMAGSNWDGDMAMIVLAKVKNDPRLNFDLIYDELDTYRNEIKPIMLEVCGKTKCKQICNKYD